MSPQSKDEFICSGVLEHGPQDALPRYSHWPPVSIFFHRKTVTLPPSLSVTSMEKFAGQPQYGHPLAEVAEPRDGLDAR